MPSKRFFNLSEEKRIRITQAALEELSRVPIEDMSINQIIRNAGIPRGSFYEYFDDKYDLLSYVMSEFRQAQRQNMLKSLAAHDWDIFAVALDVLDNIIAYGTNTLNFAHFKNVFACAAPGARHIKGLFQFDMDRITEALLPHLPAMKLSISSREDIACLTELLFALVLTTIGTIFRDVERKDEIRARFIRKLELLRYGVCEHALALRAMA